MRARVVSAGTDAALTGALSERQKEALALGIAIDRLISRLALRDQGIHERPISDAKAAVVGGAFGHRETVGRRPTGRGIVRLRHAFADWRCHAARRLVKLLAIVRAPPIVHIAALVVFRSEGIETMGQFVRDQYANPAEIDRRVGGTVEERRLNEAGGDGEAIHRSDIAR